MNASSMNNHFIKTIIHKIKPVQELFPLRPSAEVIESNIGWLSIDRAKGKKEHLTYNEVVPIFLAAKKAEGCSDHTISEYTVTLKRLSAFLPISIPLPDITSDYIRAFLVSAKNLRDESKDLSQKSRVNIHVALSSFWRFACEEGYTARNIIRQIHIRKPRPPIIIPFREEEYCALLANLEFGKPFLLGETQKVHRYRTWFPLRNLAIIQLLLDTGLRASELCNLRWEDFDTTGCTVTGKGNKERYLPISKPCRKSLEEYRLIERGKYSVTDIVFIGPNGNSLDRTSLRQILVRIGDRAGVPKVFPHRFRHTFAITYLRNGGDIYTLQAILGHEDLEMCKRYLAIARMDIVRIHNYASPIEIWTRNGISRECNNQLSESTETIITKNDCSTTESNNSPVNTTSDY
jgi:integrase/recombinase XerD